MEPKSTNRREPLPKAIAFGQRMRERRNTLGLSQQFVADKLGLSKASIAHYESGLIVFPLELLENLAGCLECTISFLVVGLEEDLDEDWEWFIYLARQLSLLNSEPLRKEFKQRMRDHAKRDAEFMLKFAPAANATD